MKICTTVVRIPHLLKYYRNFAYIGLVLIAFAGSGIGPVARAQDAKAKAKKVTFKDVSAVFQSRCNSCHNGDKKAAGLALDNYLTAMEGGGSGKVISPGSPDESTLLLVVNHTEEPHMPPKAPKIPDAEIAVLKQWIEGGALESENSAAAMPKKPKFEFKLDPSKAGKPAGAPAVPETVATEPVNVPVRPNPVLAMAHSPWAPVVAVAGHKQVLLYRTDGVRRLAGVLPFPEGNIHSLKFSRSGDLLLAGGGRGGQSGIGVAWNVKTGARVFEIGKDKEYDAVLSADISPDHSMVALGGPGKVVRVYNTADGALLYELRKHTEWITALAFSPDGVLLATGDRNSGLLVWEALTGREFFDLRGHNTAITDISWRADSNVVASASMDSTVKLWEMNNGTQIKSWGAHGNGVHSVRFALDGRLVSAGRDNVVRSWDQNGAKQRDFEPFGDLAIQATFNQDGTQVIGGDFTGEIRVWNAADGVRLGTLSGNPKPVAQRLVAANAEIAATQTALDNFAKELTPLQTAVTNANNTITLKATAFAEAEKLLKQRQAETANVTNLAAQATAAETAANAEVLKAQTLVAQRNSEKAVYEKAVADATAAEKPASDAVTAAKSLVEKIVAEKTPLDATVTDLSQKLRAAKTKAEAEAISAQLTEYVLKLVEKTSQLANTAKGQVAAQQRWEEVTANKMNAAASLTALPNTIKAAMEALQKAQVAQTKATQAKAAAAKIVADSTITLKAAQTALDARKAERDQAVANKAAAEKAFGDKAAGQKVIAAKLDGLKADAAAMTAELAKPPAAAPAPAPAPAAKPIAAAAAAANPAPKNGKSQ